MRVELIPSAKRLIRSLRDIGYEFVDAVADIVDNSVEAQATIISITLKFEGEDSYLTIADNGVGMASKDIQEALRFGSNRAYEDSDDLGRYGLGLKTASLSQCERLTVSARRGEERARINSYCWDLDHIEQTNRWEILKIESDEIKDEVWRHLHETTGTVVTWERLGRLLGYKYPSGEYARKQAEQMAESLKLHLGMVFHRFLSGEIQGKRIAIYINDQRVTPWDPYSRGERHTQKLEPILIPLDFGEGIYNVKVQPYILPPQSLYSSTRAHLQASGPGKWNKQQGLYIYRSNRIIQAGGWSGLRTSDEHTKLVRMAVFIPSQLDELFQVNVAKKHLTLPRELRSVLLKEIQPIIHRAQGVYRDKLVSGVGTVGAQTAVLNEPELKSTAVSFSVADVAAANHAQGKSGSDAEQIDGLVKKTVRKAGFSSEEKQFNALMANFFQKADEQEKQILVRLLRKFVQSD
jgi:hypothetical protein